MSRSRRLSPWLVLFLGGTLMGLAIHAFVPRRTTLVLDGGRVTYVLRTESAHRGRPLTEAERAAVIAELKDEEILLAEARRRGHLQRRSVHGRLLKKMRFLFTEDLIVPSDAELKAVYDENAERFLRQDTAVSKQVSFAEALPLLRGAWTMEKQRAAIQRRTREVMSRYRVFLEDVE